jgi:hypothetical protein
VTVPGCGCGGGGESQLDPSIAGKYPVRVVTAKFPNRQRVAQTNLLRLSVRNVGDKALPNTVVSLFIDRNAQGSFQVVENAPGQANQSRPVWILNNLYPKLADNVAPAGADAAQTNTFQFGSLAKGETKEMRWSLTPVRGGTHTLRYQLAASLEGQAQAVNEDGSPVRGQFVVSIATKPPKAGVNDKGQPVILK